MASFNRVPSVENMADVCTRVCTPEAAELRELDELLLLETFLSEYDEILEVFNDAAGSALARLKANDCCKIKNIDKVVCLEVWKEWHLARLRFIHDVDKFVPTIDERIQQMGGVFSNAFKDDVEKLKRQILDSAAEP